MNVSLNEKIKTALHIVPVNIRSKLLKALLPYENTVQEIVLRAMRPVCVYLQDGQRFLTESCVLTKHSESTNLIVATLKDVTDAFNTACGFSVYSHLGEIRNGFVTVRGGHRVGISGTAVVESGKITNIRDISTISIRIARESIGCAGKLTASIVSGDSGVLICGSPSSGKTTILRDIARTLSVVYSHKVSVVDSRGEIGSVYAGVCQNDLGLCDVLDGYPRSVGIEHAIRTLSPEFIICDEIGSVDDAQAIIMGVNSGVRFVATMHASTVDELNKRSCFKDVMTTNAFDKVVMLRGKDNPSQVKCEYSKDVFDFD